MWLLFKEIISYLPKIFQDEKLKFDQVYFGTKVQPKRSLVCSNMVQSKMEMAVGQLYIRKYFNNKSKKEALNMVNNLLSEFKLILNENEWMEDESKRRAIEKVHSIDTKIGYSDQILNDTYLDILYENVNLFKISL
jgi:predicted metalloendopeptidase